MKVTLVATTFEATVCGTKTYGFCIYDEYGQFYDNTSETPIIDDMDLLCFAKENDSSDIKCLFDFIQENTTDMTINNTHYYWDEIKKYF